MIADSAQPGGDAVRVLDQSPRISGTLIVLTMFGFGILSTLMIWTYWNWHIEPFMPLQLAIENEFEDSSPRVEGGQRKMSKKTPRILRVTMRVDFDPSIEANAKQSEQRIQRVAELAGQHQDLTSYEFLEFHFYQPVPRENRLRKKSFTRSLPDVEPVETKFR